MMLCGRDGNRRPGGKQWQPTAAGFMASVNCGLTARDRDLFRNCYVRTRYYHFTYLQDILLLTRTVHDSVNSVETGANELEIVSDVVQLLLVLVQLERRTRYVVVLFHLVAKRRVREVRGGRV